MRDRAVWSVLSDASDRWPERVALTYEDQSLTFAELRALAEDLAARLHGAGVTKGDRVVVWAANRPEWVALEYGLARLGAILVPANTALGREDLGYLVAHAKPKVLIIGREARGHRLDKVLADDPIEGVPVLLMEGGEVQGARALFDLPPTTPHPPAAAVTLDDPINMQYTSGTTGRPKGVLLSARNIVNNGVRCGDVLGLSPEDRVLCHVPLFHCFGCVVAILASHAHGASVHLTRTFDPATSLELIERRRITVVHGVPTMFLALLDHPDRETRDLSSLRTGIMAGADCAPSIVRRVVMELGATEIISGYGLTEASPHVCYTPRTEPVERKLGTVGIPLAGTTLRVVDPETLEDTARGEVWIHGEQVMLGYYQDPVATAATITADGWLRTGDLGELTDGRLAIVGRIKEMILRGGENVYPAEVEEALRTLKGVAQVAVFGVPDARLGEQVACAVVPARGATLDPETLLQSLSGRIARTKIPARLYLVDELPMTGSGKIKRHVLTARFSSPLS